MTQIPLDSKLGINAVLTYCPICGGEANELILAGSSIKWKCPSCEIIHIVYAGKKPKTCPKCGVSTDNWERTGKVDGERDRLPATQPCDKCQEILDKTNILICKKCRRMYEADAVRMLKEIDLSKFPTLKTSEDLVREGYAEKVVGQVRYSDSCESCEEKT